MQRTYLLRAYALLIGAGLLILGLTGFTFARPNMPSPENLLHLGVGLLFFAGGTLLEDLRLLRSFLGGMGVVLLLGKATIVSTRWFDQGVFELPLVGVVCLVAGLTSLLLALFTGSGASSED